MLSDKFCILSFPSKGKHYVLRTADTDDSIILNIDGVTIGASLTSINDSYDEANKVFNNLKG